METRLTKLAGAGLVFQVTHRVPFEPTAFDDLNDVKSAFGFAWDMTFGKRGGHRDHRAGGLARRKNGEIFANTFQGKLAEFAVCQVLDHAGIRTSPDLSVMGLGRWDSFDLKVGELAVAVKSTKRFGNLLLLEAADWNADGTYRHGGAAPTELTALVRIDPSPEDLLRNRRLLFATKSTLRDLKWAVAPIEQFRFHVVGAVTRELISSAVRGDHFIPRGSTLNNGTVIDADNFYVQACDFLPVADLLRDPWIPDPPPPI